MITSFVTCCCITHKIDFEQPYFRTAILFKMTSFEEFAALAESEEKERGPLKAGKTA
jgi:hypothetical protein